MSIKNNKNRFFLGALVLLLLVFTFFAGSSKWENAEPDLDTKSVVNIDETLKAEENAFIAQKPQENETVSEKETEISASQNITNEPLIAEDENTSPKSPTCTLTVRCNQVFENLDKLTPGKADIIPKDGIIYKKQKVEFADGESVFDVLLREMKNNKIHFEFVQNPVYNSAYIEGIGNLYEFDCGDCSGWVYKVNNVSPTYGCSQYKLKDGDEIEFIYSCNFLAYE